MFAAIRDFFKGGFEEINEVIVKPFLRLSFYQKCFLIILAGLALYLPYLNAFNATHDEQYTMLMCRFDVVKMIKTIAVEDGHPPLSYLYAKLWIALFGGDIHNILALRFATLFTFFLTALLGVFPLKRLLGEKVALLFVCLIFVLPSSFYLAMNMRMYPLAVFLMGGEFIYAMLFVYKPQKGDVFKFALFSMLALYTHYYCVILSAVVWMVVFIDLLRLKKYRDLIAFFVCGFCVAVLFAPWLFAFYIQYQNMKDTWYPQMSHAFNAIDGAVFSYRYIVEAYYKFLCFFGVFCWLLVFEFLFDAKKEKTEHIVVKRATIVFWSIYLIALALSLFMRPNLHAIYLTIPLVMFYMGIAVSLVHFEKFRTIFLSFFALIFVMGYSENYLKVQDKAQERMKNYLTYEMPKNSLVLYNHTWGHLMMMFNAPDKDIYYVPMEKYLVLFQDEVQGEEKHLENLQKYDKIYYLLSLWDLMEFSNCDAQFTSKYDDVSCCFREISKESALEQIKRKKMLREISYHKTSLR